MGSHEGHLHATQLDALDYQRSVQVFHGLRQAQLLEQLEDVRKLVINLAGLDPGLDPLLDPDCAVHDAVSSLLSQYVDRVGSISAAAEEPGSSGHPGRPSPTHQPQPSEPGPLPFHGTAHSQGPPPAPLQSSAFPSVPPSSRSTGAGSTVLTVGIPPSLPSLGAEACSIPPQEHERAVKRPLARFSTAKWVSAVVRAMALTHDKSELDRLEGGLEALARAEHDWLAAKLEAVAGGRTRLPPSRVEEVTAVGLELWVEFWRTWAGRTLARSSSTVSSSMHGLSLSRPGSSSGRSSGQRMLRRGRGSGKWLSSSSSNGSNSSSFVEREGIPVAGPQHTQRMGKWRSNSVDREEASSLSEHPAHEGAAFFNVDLRSSEVEGPLEHSLVRSLEPPSVLPEDCRPTSVQAESLPTSDRLDTQAGCRPSAGQGEVIAACGDSCVRIPGATGSRVRDTGEGRAAQTAVSQQNGTVRESRSHGCKPNGECLNGCAGCMQQSEVADTEVDGYEVQAGSMRMQAEEMKTFSLQRALHTESALRADIGCRLQGSLLEEFLLESSQHTNGLEPPPSHADVVRLLGLAGMVPRDSAKPEFIIAMAGGLEAPLLLQPLLCLGQSGSRLGSCMCHCLKCDDHNMRSGCG